MNIAEIENERLQIDNELDGFSEFVVIRSYQNIRIVHRDSKKWQGIIDDMDNVILPLVYDKIELDDNGIRLFLKDENDQFLIAKTPIGTMNALAVWRGLCLCFCRRLVVPRCNKHDLRFFFMVKRMPSLA